MSVITVNVWSDIACPWCYVGKRRLDAALEQFEGRDAVQVAWRSFELDTEAPQVRDDGMTYAERLAKKYQRTAEQGQEMIDSMVQAGREAGVELRFDLIRPGNTMDAHRLLHLAAESGDASALKERLLRAYLTEGVAIGDPAALAPLAVGAGLDAAAVADLLATDRYASAVRADEEAARTLGISGVPFFVVAPPPRAGGEAPEALGLSGAQPPHLILQALRQVAAGSTD